MKKYAYTFQSTKNYLFYCCIVQIKQITATKTDDKIIKIIAHIQRLWAAGFPYTDRPFVQLGTGLLQKCEFQIISIMKLKMHDTTAESLSSSRA